MLAMSNVGHHHPLGRSITAQLVSNNDARLASGCPQQPAKEPDGGKPISPRLHENVQDKAVLINRSPEVMRDAVDLEEDLVQMPFVARRARRLLRPAANKSGNLPHQQRTVS